MIKVAISGAGAIAERAHIPALKTVADAQIVAIQSRTAEKAQRVADTLWPGAQPKPNVYSDYDQMLERERPDAVCIFTPNHLHCQFTLKAIAAGAHVLVEKPMTSNVADARKMVDAASRARRILMVAMQRRYGGLERAVKDAVAGGAIGKPHFIRARLSHGGPGSWAPGQKWFTTAAEAGGGAMLDLGVHVADLAIWIMGEIDSVSGQVGTLAKDIEVEDTGVMIAHFKSGAIGVIEASWSSMPALSAMEIYGGEGRVMVGYPHLDIAVQKADGTPVPGFSRDEIMNRFDPLDLLAPFRKLSANFIDAIQGKAEPFPGGLHGLRAVEAIEACYRSSQTGNRIKLPLNS
jgi:UDP-N-acetylglucosamine 3-dehydrogenase